MAAALRLIAAVLLLWAGQAHAVVSSITYYYVSSYTSLSASSQEEACTKYIAYLNSIASIGATDWVYTYYTPYCHRYSATANVGQSLGYGTTTGCPANSTSGTSGCSCNSGYEEDSTATSCVVTGTTACAALAGTLYEENGLWNSAASEYYTCSPNGTTTTCLVKYTAAVTVGTGSNAGSVGDGYYTGGVASTCSGTGTASDSPASSASETGCPSGKVSGTVNGITTCVAAGTDGTATTTQNTTNGTTTTTNSDGSTTTVTKSGTTTCTSGQCTTTTTTSTTNTGTDGTSTTTTTSSSTTQSKTSYCSENSSSLQCVDDGSDTTFSGDCTSGWVADSGDAVENAMAVEQHTRNCEMLTTTGDVQTEIATEMAKTGNQTGDNENNSEEDMSGSIDTSDALGGGSCSLSKTITVRGQSVTLPFDNLCDPLALFGYLLVAVASLLAGRIVMRG
ncbi:MAG: virulence factor TspB C-terminal domain-related protein [Pseudomonas sp.]